MDKTMEICKISVNQKQNNVSFSLLIHSHSLLFLFRDFFQHNRLTKHLKKKELRFLYLMTQNFFWNNLRSELAKTDAIHLQNISQEDNNATQSIIVRIIHMWVIKNHKNENASLGTTCICFDKQVGKNSTKLELFPIHLK